MRKTTEYDASQGAIPDIEIRSIYTFSSTGPRGYTAVLVIHKNRATVTLAADTWVPTKELLQKVP